MRENRTSGSVAGVSGTGIPTPEMDQPLCLVSSNAWDVIGARAAGLMAIWVLRDPKTVFED